MQYSSCGVYVVKFNLMMEKLFRKSMNMVPVEAL